MLVAPYDRNKWMWINECACELCCCCWCRHGVCIEECTHRTTTNTTVISSRKIIATNSMFKPDFRKKTHTHPHTHRHAIFCAYFTVALVVGVGLNGAQCDNSCARSLCLCRFCVRVPISLLFFYHPHQISVQRWLNVLAPHRRDRQESSLSNTLMYSANDFGWMANSINVFRHTRIIGSKF